MMRYIYELLLVYDGCSKWVSLDTSHMFVMIILFDIAPANRLKIRDTPCNPQDISIFATATLEKVTILLDLLGLGLRDNI